MRDIRFIAEHRGGSLSKEKQRLLILWSVDCVRHGIQTLLETEIDDRALEALDIAVKWGEEKATVAEARNAAVKAHSAARDTTDKIKQAIYRACGHAVATAHMADHSLHARAYILKALQLKKIETEKEKKWQLDIADKKIQELVMPFDSVL